MGRFTAPRIIGLVGLATVLAGCGPTGQDIGRMALMSAPVWFGLGWFALAALLPLWRRILVAHGLVLRADARPSLVTAVILLVGAVYGGMTLTGDGWSYFAGEKGNYILAAAFAGFGYVTAMLLAWRIWGSWGMSAAFSWAPVAAIAAILLLAWVLVAGLAALEDAALMGLALVVLAGFWAIPTGLIWVLLLYEAWARSRSLP